MGDDAEEEFKSIPLRNDQALREDKVLRGDKGECGSGAGHETPSAKEQRKKDEKAGRKAARKAEKKAQKKRHQWPNINGHDIPQRGDWNRHRIFL